ncbi:MAG: tRNA (guanosine(46)-N7)-methyltransferase TrmB [Akkermansiaceae bacterium]
MPTSSESSSSASCSRKPSAGEFMPGDYFKRIHPSEIFGNSHPVEIDLGCGDGTFLIEMAKKYPERNFLGVERLLGRVRGVCKQITDLGLTNAKVLRLESNYTVEYLLENHSISRLHLLCPDPWPKARHHKRRLVQQPFLTNLHQLLSKDGEFLFKTDHPEYFEWVCEEMETFQKFRQLDWAEDAFFYPKTDFQRLWESEGKKIHRLRFQPVD